MLSVYEMEFVSHNIATHLWDGRGDRLYVDYRYSKNSDELTKKVNPANSLYMDLEVVVTDRLAVSAIYEYNFLEDTPVQAGLGINYKAQCWSFYGQLTNRTGVDGSQNLGFEFRINLYGLGEFGL